jgi:hypothetical protein
MPQYLPAEGSQGARDEVFRGVTGLLGGGPPVMGGPRRATGAAGGATIMARHPGDGMARL